MGEGRQDARHALRQAIGDFARLVARAFFGGLGAAVLMALAIVALIPSAHAAAPDEAKAGALFFRAAGGGFDLAPQVSTEIAVEVTGMVARTRVTQRFHNPGSGFVEGLYVFPLPEKAAVDRLRKRGWRYADESRVEVFDFRYVRVFSPRDYAEVGTSERWYVPTVRADGSRVEDRNVYPRGLRRRLHPAEDRRQVVDRGEFHPATEVQRRPQEVRLAA